MSPDPVGDLTPHVFKAPIAVGPSSLLDALQLLAGRGDPAELQAFMQLFWQTPQAQPSDDPIRVIRIVGSLFRGMFFDDYADIRASVDAAIEDPNVRGIILDVDSPGGQLSGLFDLAGHLLSLREADKPIWAIANDQATSAAYAIASTADRIVSTETGLVGSIGVLAVHVDESEEDEKLGLKFTEIASGQRKTDLSRHKPLNARGRAFLQEMVDRNAEVFFEHVSEARGLSVDAIRDQEAGMFIGQDARDASLIDGLSTLDELVEEMKESFASPGLGGSVITGSGPTAGGTTMSLDPDKKGKGTEEEPAAPTKPAAPAPAAEPAAPEGGAEVISIDKAREEGAAGERARVADISRLCRLANAPHLTTEFLEEGLTADQVGARLLEMQANDDERLGDTRGQLSDANANGDDPKPKINVNRIYERWNDPAALARPAGEEV